LSASQRLAMECPATLLRRTPDSPIRINPALLLGAVTGAVTSTLAVDVVTEAAHSGVPALGCAGTRRCDHLARARDRAVR